MALAKKMRLSRGSHDEKNEEKQAVGARKLTKYCEQHVGSLHWSEGTEWWPCGNKSLVLTRRKVEVNVLNTLKMVVDGIGVDFTQNKAGLVMNHFVAVEGYAQVATRRPRMTREHTLSIHAMTVGHEKPTLLSKFSCKLKKITRKCRYICVEGSSLRDHSAWEFLVGHMSMRLED